MFLRKYIHIALPFLLTLLCLPLLLSTIPASVYLGDCGETISVSYTLGIQHPPGYPLHTLIAKIFTLIEIGDISFRIYLFSVFLSLLNLILIYFFTLIFLPLINIKKENFFIPFLASLFYIFGFTIWQQSIIAKGGIYIFNIMFLILLSIILIKIFNNKKIKYIYLFSFVFGLSLTHHHMSQLALFPAYFYFLYRCGIFNSLKTKNFIFIILFFLLGISVYLYHPIRAKIAILNWGDPSNLKNFLWVLTRYQYIGSEITRSFFNSFNQFLKFFLCIFYEYLIAGFIFILIGFIFLYKKNKTLFFYFILIPFIFLILTTFYLNLSKERLYIMETYITPVYFPLSVLLAIGIYYLMQLNKKAYLPLFMFAFLLVFLQIFIFYPKLDKSRYYFAYDYNKNILLSSDFSSILFTSGDGVVFPTWYLKYVKKFRQDITLVGSPVLPMKWVRDNIKKQNPNVFLPEIKTDKIGTESTGKIINAIIKLNINNFPIYFSYNKPEENAIDSTLNIMPKGLIFRAIPGTYSYITEQYIKTLYALWKIYSMRTIFPPFKNYADDKTKELYIQDYAISLNSAGVFFEEKEFFNEALFFYHYANKIFPNDPVYIFNAGNVYYALKNFEKAIESYKKSISINPKYENAWYNLGVTYYNLKDFKQALYAFEQVKQINPVRKDLNSTIDFLLKVINKN